MSTTVPSLRTSPSGSEGQAACTPCQVGKRDQATGVGARHPKPQRPTPAPPVTVIPGELALIRVLFTPAWQKSLSGTRLGLQRDKMADCKLGFVPLTHGTAMCPLRVLSTLYSWSDTPSPRYLVLKGGGRNKGYLLETSGLVSQS